MLPCLDGIKHLLSAAVNCCDGDYKQPTGLEDPEALARETVCTSNIFVKHFETFMLIKPSGVLCYLTLPNTI